MTPSDGSPAGREGVGRRDGEGSLGWDGSRGGVEERVQGSKCPRIDYRCRYREEGSEMDASEGDEGGCNQARADPVECPTWKGAFGGAGGTRRAATMRVRGKARCRRERWCALLVVRG